MAAVEEGEELAKEEEEDEVEDEVEEDEDGVEKAGEADGWHFWRGRVMLSYTGAAATQWSLTCR